MGSIRTREESGTLYLDFRYRNVRCRELTALPPTKANIARLERLLSDIEREIQAGTFNYRKYFPNSNRAGLFSAPAVANTVTPGEIVKAVVTAANDKGMAVPASGLVVNIDSSPIFATFCDTWFDDREVDWKRSTRIKVRDIMNQHLIPAFKGRTVGDITREDILRLRTHLAKDFREGQGLSPARINGILNVLRQILEEAADRLNFTTPFRNVKSLRVPKTNVDPLSLAEVMAFLDALPPAFRPYYTVAFFSALRTSELNGLKWTSVDFDRRQILVREALVYGELDSTKTYGSERHVAMSSIVFEALRDQQKLAAAFDSEFVFCASNGEAVNYRNLANRVWHPTLKTLGLRRRTPYQTRHTAATLWLAAGESPEWIAKQMGHTTTKMLFTVYSRFVPNLTRQDGSAFERLLQQTGAIQPVDSAANDEGLSQSKKEAGHE